MTSTRTAHRSLLVIAPTARELGSLRGLADVRVATVGIGGRSADALTELIAEHRPALVLSLGFAGALKPGLLSGSLTLHGIMACDGNCIALMTGHGTLNQQTVAALAVTGIPLHEGPLLTVDQPLLTPIEKHGSGITSGAIAVDMEGYWLAEAAAEAGIPFIAVRAILDEVNHTLPRMVAAIIADGGHNEWQHAIRSIGSPRSALALIPLASRSRKAARALRAAALALLPTLAHSADRGAV